MSRYCCCRPGQPLWPVRPDDHYCCVCGRQLLAVLPLAPVLSLGPPPVVAVYLQPDAHATQGLLTGRLTLQLVGLGDATPCVRLQPVEELSLILRAARLVGFSELRLELAAPPADSLGRAALTVAWNGQPFSLEVQPFVPPDVAERVDFALARGGVFRDGVLWLERGVAQVDSRLILTMTDDLPVQWQALECRHAAVRVAMIEGETAAPRAEARVTWNPTLMRLDGAGEEVWFHVRLRGRPRLSLRQVVRWRVPELPRPEPVTQRPSR